MTPEIIKKDSEQLIQRIADGHDKWNGLSELRLNHFNIKMRFPNGIICPRCGSGNGCRTYSPLKWRRSRFQCNGCRYHFGVFAGTVFKGSKILLRPLYFIIWEVVKNKNNNSVELAKKYGVSQKTAHATIIRIQGKVPTSGRDWRVLKSLSIVVGNSGIPPELFELKRAHLQLNNYFERKRKRLEDANI